jgi:MoaA/NifB/PqqE/SkfB family radical SAM enzyme
MGKYGEQHPFYQGNIQQVQELCSALPHLKHVTIYGNPDISVDPMFCNEVAKFLQENEIEMNFFTSGIGGAKTFNKVMSGINTKFIHKIVFSVDSIDENVLSTIKGVKMSLQTIIDGMEYCKRASIPFDVSIVVWPANADENLVSFKELFKSYGAQNIYAHFGSIEGAIGHVEHVAENKVIEIRERYRANSININCCLVDDVEYKTYLDEFIKKEIIPCKSPKNGLTVHLEKDGVSVSPFCQYLTAIHPEYYTSLYAIQDLHVPVTENVYECPVSEQTFGYRCEKLHQICRFYMCDRKQ